MLGIVLGYKLLVFDDILTYFHFKFLCAFSATNVYFEGPATGLKAYEISKSGDF